MDKSIYREVPECVHNAVLDALDSLEDYSVSKHRVAGIAKKSRVHISKAAVIVLACLLVTGVTASAMGVVSLYRQRMEEMNEKTVENFYELAHNGEATELGARSFTDDEIVRMEELTKEYKKNGLFPSAEITYIESVDEYTGTGVAVDRNTRILYLPEAALSDEELLQIIDFNHKMSYSIYEKAQERILSGSDWMSRMAKLTDEEVDETYIAYFSGQGEIGGAYSRSLTAAENVRYGKLNKAYEEDNMYTESEVTLIVNPEEYTGEGIALCRINSTFYLPKTELTDEELLQIIDFQHKVNYCAGRINDEISMGFRDGYPSCN